VAHCTDDMKIICVGRNYVEHAKELNNDIPTEPLLFMKPDSALLTDDKPFFYPNFSNDIHYECELVLKIGKAGKCIAPEFAHRYYDAIGLGIDFTARDIQQRLKTKGHPWEIAKAFDGSAILGRFIPTDQLTPHDISFHLTKNGHIVQQGNSKDLLFSFDVLVSYISHYFKLMIGDYIFTGTPAGVGPVAINDVLEGFVGDKKLLHCEIK
jgi:acylpyruvate hydrolase